MDRNNEFQNDHRLERNPIKKWIQTIYGCVSKSEKRATLLHSICETKLPKQENENPHPKNENKTESEVLPMNLSCTQKTKNIK